MTDWVGGFSSIPFIPKLKQKPQLSTTPPKTNMEPENTALEKEKHLQTTNFWFHVSFRGCKPLSPPLLASQIQNPDPPKTPWVQQKNKTNRKRHKT